MVVLPIVKQISAHGDALVNLVHLLPNDLV